MAPAWCLLHVTRRVIPDLASLVSAEERFRKAVVLHPSLYISGYLSEKIPGPPFSRFAMPFLWSDLPPSAGPTCVCISGRFRDNGSPNGVIGCVMIADLDRYEALLSKS